jgi:TPR repeat protein
LKARIAADATGRARITIAIATLEGNPLAERSVTMVIGTPPLQSAAEGASSNGTGLPIFRPKPPDRNLAAKLIAAGHDSMTVGNVLVARQFYQRAAEYGLADAATALAATYDKVELQRMGNMASVQPDPKLAKRWYEIAEQLRAQDVSAEVPKPR